MRAAAYRRYSTEKQTENSIAYQTAEIQKYCAAHGIELCAYYADEAQSGTNTDRSGFLSMVAAAKRHEFDAVVIYDITRGSRDVSDWFASRKDMMRLGITVISATQNLGDITNPSDFLHELISVGLGQHQVLDTRAKSIAGTAERAKQGLFCGGYAPLGYDIIDGRYTVNNYEADAVRKIFALYASGRSYNYIIDQLNGFIGKRGQRIGKNSLNSILKNERYIGHFSWNTRKQKLFGKWAGGAENPNAIHIDNIIPRIIDDDTWERVQKRMSDNKRKANNKAKENYLLSGLIECDACGSSYVGHCSTNKKGYKTRYYVCGNKYRTRNCCSKNINADEIESFVIQQLKAYLLGLDFDAMAKTIADQINSASPDLSAEKKELASITTKINNGMKAILDGMKFQELEDELDRLRIRKSELEDVIARRSMTSTAVSPNSVIDVFNFALENFGNPQYTKEILQQLITKIYAHVDGSYTVNIGVHINGCGGAKSIVCTTFYFSHA